MAQSGTNYAEAALSNYASITNDFVLTRSYITTGIWSKWSFDIKDGWNVIDIYDHTSVSTLNNIDTLKIWANSTNSSQWDWIIDFVKIYK